MPRIPTRTEPYTSPARQHRHYKTKRDLILRSLGKASYINGCQFAVTFISARGDVEVYGSEMCSERLNELFDKSILEEIASRVKDTSERRREEAIRNGEASDGRREASVEGVERESNGKLISVAAGAGKRKARVSKPSGVQNDKEDGCSEMEGGASSEGEMTDCGDNPDEELEETQTSVNFVARSPTPNPLTRQRTSILMEAYMNPHQMASAAGISLNNLQQYDPGQSLDNNSSGNTRSPITTPIRRSGVQGQVGNGSAFETPLASHSRNDDFANCTVTPSAGPAAVPTFQLGSAFVTPGVQRSRSNTSMSTNPPSMTPSQIDATPVCSTSQLVSIAPHEIHQWYTSRFDALQQQTCKIVVKAWIKVMEPKKQTRYPYNKGEQGKPPWWPQGVRHREPDHLMKPERTDLAIAILRSNDVKVSQLEISTAENLAYIVPGKMTILREIYRAAKEDERMRELQDDTSDIVISISNSPPAPVAKSSRATSLKPLTSDSVKNEFPATLPRANLRTLSTPFASSPIASASGSSSTIVSSTGTSCDSNHTGINGNFRLPPGAPALKKRKLTQKASLSLDNHSIVHDQENTDPALASGLRLSTPTKQPGTTKRVRSTRHPGPIAIGTVQLDDHRPNTAMGIRTAKVYSHDGPRANPTSLAPSPIPGPPLATSQWRNSTWSMEPGMMVSGVPDLVNNVAPNLHTPYGAYPLHSHLPGRPNGSSSGSSQPFLISPSDDRARNSNWLVSTSALSQQLQPRNDNALFTDSQTSLLSGRSLSDQSTKPVVVRESRRVLGENRSAGNQANLPVSDMQDAFSHEFGTTQALTGSQLGYAFFGDQHFRQNQNITQHFEPDAHASGSNHLAARSRSGKESSSDCATRGNLEGLA